MPYFIASATILLKSGGPSSTSGVALSATGSPHKPRGSCRAEREGVEGDVAVPGRA